jgi:hypothetical protein
MNKSRLIWGIVCLVIAGGLAIANLRLPPENLMFDVGGENMPWVPVIILGIIGVTLVATAPLGRNEGHALDEAEKPKPVKDPERAALNKRLETMAWGAFLIMLGGFMFVPEEIIKGGWWSIGVGLIMLGLNAARYFNGLRMSGFTTFLGVLAVIGGVLDLVGIQGIDGAILLIALGGYLIIKPWLEKRQLFGKAEEA